MPTTPASTTTRPACVPDAAQQAMGWGGTSVFTRYRTVLAYSGAWRFSLAAFVARLPISVSTLGIVLLMTGLGRSYGLAGAVSAAFTIANGLSSVVQGRLLDRLGQAVVLPIVTAVYAVGIVGLVASAESGWPDGLAFGSAFLAGAAFPPIGSVVRARWSHVLTGRPADVQTAYALESVIDEVIFVVGPTVATVLATQWHPWAGLALALLSGVPGTLALAAQRGSQPVPHRTMRPARRRSVPPGRSDARRGSNRRNTFRHLVVRISSPVGISPHARYERRTTRCGASQRSTLVCAARPAVSPPG